MISLRFRFYGPLNIFLAPSRRHGQFALRCDASRSIKDIIESLGVPHPEVALIVVNGSAVDFGHHPNEGDDVAVYPAFQSIDVSGLDPVTRDPLPPARFVLDAHLGKLASWLRLCGVDAVVRDDDEDVAAVADREERVALSRDVALLKRRAIRHGYWVRHTDPEQQLVEILERFDLSRYVQPLTRCLRCNTPLAPIDPSAVADRLSERTRECFHAFERCPGCERVYWKGSHYDRLVELIDRVLSRVEGRSPVERLDRRG